MKRAREIDDTSSKLRVAAAGFVKQNNNDYDSTKRSKPAAVTLEEIRAKLERARTKKNAAEERLLRQRNQDSRQIHQQESAPPTLTPAVKSAVTTASATATANKPSTTDAVVMPTTAAAMTTISQTQNRAQEAQLALDRARSKLQGALQNRERALQQRKNHAGGSVDPVATTMNKGHNTSSLSWNRKQRFPQQSYFPFQQQHGRYVAHSGLPPISALLPSVSLRINNISKTGPRHMVYNSEDFIENYMELEAALGGKKAIEAINRGSDWYRNSGDKRKSDDVNNSKNNFSDNIRGRNEITKNHGKHATDITTTKKSHNATNISLVQRKLQLQSELMALKEKLETMSSREQELKQKHQHGKDQKTNNVPANGKDLRKTKPTTKEGLERRKAEAQTIMDISYWKHFVSKQEHLLEQVTTKINNMDTQNHPHQKEKREGNTYQECLQKRHVTNKAISKVQKDLDVLEKRQGVVEEGIYFSTTKLLKARQDLYETKTENF